MFAILETLMYFCTYKREFRTLYDKKAYRLFAFGNRVLETLVVATHGIVKKSQKTPRREIAKAEALREKHFKNKKNNA